MPRPSTLAAMATIPRRVHHLPRALASLRPQVDRLHVYLNGHPEVPACVRELADDYVLDERNAGAERKFHWAPEWEGVYLTVDDDFVYTEGYVDTMVAAVRRWDGQAIVTAHGRSYEGRPKGFNDTIPTSIGIIHKRVRQGRWVNHPGTGVTAWDASALRIPREWPERNAADAQLAVWAQQHGVPIWLIPHKAAWLESLETVDPKGIFRMSQRNGHAIRNKVIYQHSRARGWKVYELP